MGIVTTAKALLELGLPALLLSWIIFYWLFSEEKIGRDLSHRALKSALKKNRKDLKKINNKKVRLIYNRWAWFGGGFYGLAGLWTFLVIEANDLASFLAGGSYLTSFSGGLLNFVISFLINQVTNSIQALLWFSYWPGPGESMLIWIAAGYLGYWAGIEMARRQLTPAAVIKFNRDPDQSRSQED
ncbi:MAG: hypothetical protein R3F50_05055 [Gammaproteobacteria bacterium]|jgi:hypothetical protein